MCFEFCVLSSQSVTCVLQEFGARDPTAGEVGSGFGKKPLGNADTSHIIM